MIKYLKPEGTFLWHCLITFSGLFFFIFVVKETTGLSDKQKKELYMPQELRDPDNSEQSSKNILGDLLNDDFNNSNNYSTNQTNTDYQVDKAPIISGNQSLILYIPDDDSVMGKVKEIDKIKNLYKSM